MRLEHWPQVPGGPDTGEGTWDLGVCLAFVTEEEGPALLLRAPPPFLGAMLGGVGAASPRRCSLLGLPGGLRRALGTSRAWRWLGVCG